MIEKALKLAGSIAGFAFEIKVTEASDESLLVTGTAGDKPASLIVKVGDDGTLNVHGMLMGKECIVNGVKDGL